MLTLPYVVVTIYAYYVSSLSTSDDFSLIVSASHDGTIKTWRTTPRHPDAPAAPRILAVTDTTALLSWVSPPCFNLDVNAFHIQWRVGAAREQWVPAQGLSVPPHYRTKVRTLSLNVEFNMLLNIFLDCSTDYLCLLLYKPYILIHT